MDIQKIVENYKFLGCTGKRGGIHHYQVIDDGDMDRIIRNDTGSRGYNVLTSSIECNQGQIQIWASREEMIDEAESIIECIENDELRYAEDEEEKEEIIEKIKSYEKILDELKNGTYKII